MTTILNCPFCGKTPSKHPRYCMGFMGFGLKCKCGCETPNHLVDEDAVKWWNKRTSMPSGVLHQNTADLIRQAAEQIDKCSQALNELKEVWQEELDG